MRIILLVGRELPSGCVRLTALPRLPLETPFLSLRPSTGVYVEEFSVPSPLGMGTYPPWFRGTQDFCRSFAPGHSSPLDALPAPLPSSARVQPPSAHQPIHYYHLELGFVLF